jgi:hypothetical protein
MLPIVDNLKGHLMEKKAIAFDYQIRYLFFGAIKTKAHIKTNKKHG